MCSCSMYLENFLTKGMKKLGQHVGFYETAAKQGKKHRNLQGKSLNNLVPKIWREEK